MQTTRLIAAIAVPAVLALPAFAAQPAFPDKPIRLIIGSAPGSGPDIISRLIADRLYAAWNQRVIVDARPGVAGIISAELALRANPDGYTWMMLTSQLFVATSVYPNLKFNLDKDFVSIALIGTVPFVQMANLKLPVKSIPDLIALAKKSPGKLRYGSAGEGASEHLCGVMFTRLTGTDMLHVPYKGVPQAIADTLAGEVQLTYAVMPAARPQVEAGRLRGLGVTSRKRAPQLPDVPAIAEFVPGYEMLGWYSLTAPIGTPDAILAKASAEVVNLVKDPEFRERLNTLGVETIGGTRADLDKFRQGQRKLIGDLVRSAHIELK
jgi:tripartite-type tricarboxylate transporter receptor subunit TctC